MRFALLFLGFSLASCSDEDTRPAPEAPCTMSLASESGADLVVVGTGSCAGRTTFKLRVATGDPAAPTWSDIASSPIKVNGTWTQKGDALVRNVEVESTSDTTLVGLEWRAEGLPFAFDRVLHQGYQSWTYTGVEAVPEAVGEALGTAKPGGDGEDAVAERAGVSWWHGAAMDGNGRGIFAGVDGGTVLPTFVAVDRTGMRVVQGMRGDAIALAKGTKKTLDGLFLALGDVSKHLDGYAAHVAALHPAATPRKPALSGWGSWNLYYTKIDATKLREEATWASSTLGPQGMKDFLLDDGYEPLWGEWHAKPEFGAELATINDEQAKLGLKSAVWLAPIYVDIKSKLVADHPDWFVKKAAGSSELRTFVNFGPTYAALDVTHPDARAHVTSSLKNYRDWGYRTIKIDFLFGAAIAGARMENITGLESYQRWMKVIREAAGDMHIVGCGAPIVPSVGWVDSMRTGPDVAFEMSPEASWQFLATQARHTAFRGFTDTWWSLDPDVVILRGTGINDAEAWTFVVSSALAGGNWLSGDGRQSTPERLAMMLAPEILALTRDGKAARPVDFAGQYDDSPIGTPVLLGTREIAAPHVWKKEHATAVFAWDSENYSTSITLPAGAKELVPEGKSVTSKPAQSGTIAVPQHGVRLFVY